MYADPNILTFPFSRQESQSRGSDETLSSPRSPEGKIIIDSFASTWYLIRCYTDYNI